jgi:hypothetical protein
LQEIITEPQAEAFVEKDDGILESYLVKIRRHRAAKTALMKQRLDTLAQNNTALVTLITAYSPHAKTAAFTSEANSFGNYAVARRDRWNFAMALSWPQGTTPQQGPRDSDG